MLVRAIYFFFGVLYARYFLVSVLALGMDFASFFLLLQMKVLTVPASMAGYSFGLGIHWLLSSRFVFAQETATNSYARMRQKVSFVASAFVGLAITAIIIEGAMRLGAGPGLAKLAAIGISFHATYFLRRSIVFV